MESNILHDLPFELLVLLGQYLCASERTILFYVSVYLYKTLRKPESGYRQTIRVAEYALIVNNAALLEWARTTGDGVYADFSEPDRRMADAVLRGRLDSVKAILVGTKRIRYFAPKAYSAAVITDNLSATKLLLRYGRVFMHVTKKCMAVVTPDVLEILFSRYNRVCYTTHVTLAIKTKNRDVYDWLKLNVNNKVLWRAST